MTRGLDHIVHAVHDLDAAASFYERIGFTVGARNLHPWGTCFRIARLPDCFIEIVAIADQKALDAAAADSIGAFFGRTIRDQLLEGEGFAFVMLTSSDAEADAAEFAQRGIARSRALTRLREASAPNGAKTGYSLVFAGDASSGAGFAVCQSHGSTGSNNLTQHANGARGLNGVVMVADNPSDHHIFLEAFTGDRAPRSTSLGLVARTVRGDVEIVEAPFFRDAYGIAATIPREGVTIAALRIAVDDVKRTSALLSAAGIGFSPRRAGLVIGPDRAFGATLVFENK